MHQHNKFKAVLFDMDGTMFDTERLIYETIRKALTHVGKKDLAVLYLNSIGRTDEDIVAYLEKAFEINTDEEGEEFLKLYNFYLDQILTEASFNVKPGLTKLLESIQSKGIKWGIVSSSTTELIEKFCRWANLEYTPDVMISGSDIVAGKPRPEPYLAAANKLGLSYQDCLVIEDSPLGVEAARRADMAVIMVPDLVKATPFEKEYALAVVETLEDVIAYL